MPSSYTASLRFEKQFTGENVNTWGNRWNAVSDKIDYAIAGRSAVVTTGSLCTLTTSNSDDEARAAILAVSGTGGTIIIPSVSKNYRVENNASAAVVISTGSGMTVQVDPGDVVDVFCTGTAVKTLGYNSLSLKDYIASVLLGATIGLPAVAGNAGKYMYTNGSSVVWRTPITTDLSDYTSDQSIKAADALGKAIAFAVAL